MADISKVLVQSSTHNLKDTQARQDNTRIQQYVDESVETLEGQISSLSTRVTNVEEAIVGGGEVVSVNGQSGVVTLEYDDVGAAPASHVSKEATASSLGHVRLDDTYKNVTAAAGQPVAASAKALQDAYQELKENSLPSHAVNTGVYGLGTTNLYGHVKLNNTYNNTNPEMNDGDAASSYALQSAYQNLQEQIDDITVSPGVQSVNGHDGYSEGESSGDIILDASDVNAAPISHSSPITSSPIHGLGTNENYGHVALSDVYENDLPNIEETGAIKGIAASLYAVQKAYRDLLTLIDEAQQSISGTASEIGFDNQKSNLTTIDSTGEEVSVRNVQEAIDSIVAQNYVIEPNPEEETTLELEKIKIGATSYKFAAPKEVNIGRITPGDENIQIFIDTSNSYGNSFNLQHIEECEEGF